MGTHYIRADYIRPVPSASIWVLASFLSLRYFLSPAGNSRSLSFDLLVIFSPPPAYISLVILLSLIRTKPAFVGRSRRVAERSSVVSKLAKSSLETLTRGHPTPRLLFFRPKSSRASSRSTLLEHDHTVQMPTGALRFPDPTSGSPYLGVWYGYVPARQQSGTDDTAIGFQKTPVTRPTAKDLLFLESMGSPPRKDPPMQPVARPHRNGATPSSFVGRVALRPRPQNSYSAPPTCPCRTPSLRSSLAAPRDDILRRHDSGVCYSHIPAFV